MSAALRFTALLEHLERDEDEMRRRLGRLEAQRAELATRMDGLSDDLAGAASSTADPRLHDQFARHWRWISNHIAAVEEALAQQDKAIAAAREALVESHRKVATFAKLRERDARELRRAGERREARALDEFAIRRHLAGVGAPTSAAAAADRAAP